ncbi:MAG: hypothetical protein Q9M31_10085 [Mariprofundus sp.]|nr:hypothetical protein [Mariprofundus sp.]
MKKISRTALFSLHLITLLSIGLFSQDAFAENINPASLTTTQTEQRPTPLTPKDSATLIKSSEPTTDDNAQILTIIENYKSSLLLVVVGIALILLRILSRKKVKNDPQKPSSTKPDITAENNTPPNTIPKTEHATPAPLDEPSTTEPHTDEPPASETTETMNTTLLPETENTHQADEIPNVPTQEDKPLIPTPVTEPAPKKTEPTMPNASTETSTVVETETPTARTTTNTPSQTEQTEQTDNHTPTDRRQFAQFPVHSGSLVVYWTNRDGSTGHGAAINISSNYAVLFDAALFDAASIDKLVSPDQNITLKVSNALISKRGAEQRVAIITAFENHTSSRMRWIELMTRIT